MIADKDMTPIQDFYCDSCIFITGGTGFLGKVLIEKLLRSCPNISQIILLIREKREANCQERLDKLMAETVLQGVSPKSRMKVSAVSGDCSLPGLGLSESDRQLLIDRVSVVFHVAATVRFDEDLATAVAINIIGTKSVLDMASEMTKLKALMHVSTAYSNCNLEKIEERFYPTPYSAEKLIKLIESVEKSYLNQITPLLLNDFPNTYVYTKAIAEDLVLSHSKGLPIAVFRPSIVVATYNEPLPGWIDNLNGPSGVVVATNTGIMRTLHCDPTKVADIVPVDLVVNALIATAWKTHLRSKTIDTADAQPQVYNFVSSPENPIKWSQFFMLGMKYQIPTLHAVWYPSLKLNRNWLAHRFHHFLYHLVPAFLVDKIAHAIGKRTNLMRLTHKVDRFSHLISYFGTRQWDFTNTNVQFMWQSLTTGDKELFPFTFTQLDWDNYFKSYMRGARLYLLKDELSTIPRAMVKYNRFFWAHQILKWCLLFLLAKLVWRRAGSQCLRLIYGLITVARSQYLK